MKKKTRKTAEISFQSILFKGQYTKFLLVFVFFLVLIGFFWVSRKYYQAQAVIDEYTINQVEKGEVLKEEEYDVLASIRKLLIIPKETPTIVTIFDAENLKLENPFFENAINGDYAVFFVENRQAVLFSPKRNIIVNVGPIYTDEKLVVDNTQPISNEIISVEVRNGGTIVGAAGKFASTLNQEIYNILDINDASTSNYQGITLVNLTHKDLDALESKIGEVSTVTSLPDNERSSNADVLIIIGN